MGLGAEANAILVAHIDRLARNGIESGQLVKLFSQGIIKEIRTPSKTFNTVQDLLYLDIEFAFAADYSRRLSLRVKEGIQTKLKRGEYPRLAPIGYLNQDGNIVPDPIRSPLINQLFELFSTGEYSLSKITRVMYEQGLRTRAGNKVSKSAIHRRLQDPIYCGIISMHDKLYPGIHQPIVSQQVYDRVREVFTGNTRPKRHRHHFLYRGFLTCDNCGCMLTATRKKKRYTYYYCTNGKGSCTQGRDYLPEPRVQEMFQELVNSFVLPGDLAKASLQLYTRQLQSQTTSQETVRDCLTKEIEASDKRLGRLEDMYLEGRIDPERFDSKKTLLEVQRIQLTNQLKHLPTRNLPNTLELLDKIKDQAVNMADMFREGDDEVKENLLKSLLWNCTVMDQEIVSTRYRKPFLYLEGLSKTDDIELWRRRWDSNPRSP